MSTATLNERRVTHARVSLPAWGVGWADVSIDEEAALSGRAVLKVADLTFSGSIMSGGPGPMGRASFRLAAGAGGWGKTIPAKSYANDAGVKAATALVDAATASGETIDPSTLPPPSTRLGPSWVRESAPAARTLELVAPAYWYVRESDGITRIGKRPRTVITSPVTVATVDRARGVLVLSSESIAGLVPGAVVEGLEAVDVMHELSPGTGLTTTIWAAGISATSRRLSALRRIYEQLDPGRRFRGVFEYRIATQEGERLNLQPVRVSTGMPDLQRVPARPGVPGAKATHALGATVAVAFLDGSPARPVIVGFEEAGGGGFVPMSLSIDAATTIDLGEAFGPVIRAGDTVMINPGNGSGPVQGIVTLDPTGAPPSKVKA